MVVFQPSHQRTRRRRITNPLLLLAGVAVLVLGGRALLPSSKPSTLASEPAGCQSTQQQLEVAQRRSRELESQVAELQQQLNGGGGGKGTAATQHAAGGTGDSASSSAPYLLDPVDLARLLGPLGLLQGVTSRPQHCFPPWKESVNDAALAGLLVDKLKQQLAEALAGVAANASAEAAPRQAPILQLAGSPHVDDPKWLQLDRLVTKVLARFVLRADGSRACMCGKQVFLGSPVKSADDVGTSGCTEGEAEAEDAGSSCLGSFQNLLLGTVWGSDALAEAVFKTGVCSAHVHDQNFARWWLKERLYHPDYQNFPVKDKQEDAVLELFDLMYERNHVFLRQRWMGFTMMQDPFDLLAIQMLLYDVRPTVILETGTANGGSALLWASILEVLGLEESRIHTVDVNDPSTGFGSRDRSQDPTQHKLWKKYVTYYKGLSTDASVLAAMKAAAAGAKTVLVLLDSDHSEANVARELAAYCGFVTVGSYCIVEDTKLSRLSRYDPGPLAAVRSFLKEHPGWTADRSRELLYSQHVLGYLKRTA